LLPYGLVTGRNTVRRRTGWMPPDHGSAPGRRRTQAQCARRVLNFCVTNGVFRSHTLLNTLLELGTDGVLLSVDCQLRAGSSASVVDQFPLIGGVTGGDGG
jgi:hypothetical protein